ncbi:methyltransferase domain-containing protein [Lacticaseibacillus brantae]|uniref:SAM-dependent methyltransferase n=1 Tax=Lacticaseibacillus brantae DSM 23927 TaxID=1423727 RepID=A0A0R2AZW0_9LACO|nr:methyltransferase domain-containing protein [Lacticaseibacillus brantae]KRM72325.1 SAM-dependent methyltransferase [Lacticaseibacillus brantae DSM 23927]
MRKIEQKIEFVQANPHLFACPVCGQELRPDQTSLVCDNQHRFDLNKKGTVNFLNAPVPTEYTETMLAARRRVLDAGFFSPFVDRIAAELSPRNRVLDIGCGEGTPTAALAQSGAATVGFDISAPAIKLAGALASEAFFCVADLTKLPFLAGSFDTIVDLFSPGAYAEFARVAPGGRLFKVVPNADYLKELRQGLYAGTAKATYSNERVLDRLLATYSNATITPIRYAFKASPTLFSDVVTMTPLSWQAPEEARAELLAQPPTEVTVDVSLVTVASL